MNGMERSIGTRLALMTGRASLILFTASFLASATVGFTPAEAKAHAAPAVESSATNDAGMIRTPARLAAARDANSSPHASSELLAGRLEDVAMMTALANYNLYGDSPVAPPPAASALKSARALVSSKLPEPDGWTAVAATLALALFFFLRRLA